MKKIMFLVTVFLLLITECSFSQKLVEKDIDARKLKINEERFLNKSLSELLNEVQPKIKSVSVNRCQHDQTCYGFFVFYFVEVNEISKLFDNGKTPVTIRVYVKEKFEWELSKRPKGKEFEWTSEDVEKYGGLKVDGIYVYGEATVNDL